MTFDNDIERLSISALENEVNNHTSSDIKDKSPLPDLPVPAPAPKVEEEKGSVEIKEEKLCDICYVNKPITDFTNVGECGHEYCSECIKTQWTTYMKNNQVDSIRCLDW